MVRPARVALEAWLAAPLEDYAPRESDERDALVAVALVRAAVVETLRGRTSYGRPGRAREANLSWSVIGGFVSTSGEAARQRYFSAIA